MSLRADIVIVGAGIAGAATAHFLLRAGVPNVLLIEREDAPGRHASGKNAGLIVEWSEDPEIRALCAEGAAALRELGLVRVTGSVMIREGRRVSHPADGIVDPAVVLQHFLRGQAVLTGCAAEALELRGGRVAGVRTATHGLIEAPVVVDCAGPWAGALARAAGLQAPELRPKRRHIFVSRTRPPPGPFEWDEDRGFYWRAHAEGVLFSGCDEEDHPAREPDVDPARREEALAKAAAVAPALELRADRGWACLRTFSGDGKPVLGPDPRVPGLHYLAGLGGHGITAASAVGKRAAASIIPGP
jgi:D-arginine dehydrogenase